MPILFCIESQTFYDISSTPCILITHALDSVIFFRAEGGGRGGGSALSCKKTKFLNGKISFIKRYLPHYNLCYMPLPLFQK